MKTVMITGSGGFIGSYLTRYLAHSGYQVKALQRGSVAVPIEGVEYIQYALESPVSESVFTGTEVVIHCAYQPYDSRQQDADTLNRDGFRHLLSLCKKHQAQLIFLSSLSAHSTATSHYGKHKLALESEIRHDTDLVLKLGMVMGNGGVFEKMATAIRHMKLVPVIGGGHQPLHALSLDDLGRVIVQSIKRRLTGIIPVGIPQAIPLIAFYKKVATAMGKRPMFVPVPAGVLAPFIAIAERMGLSLPVTMENIRGMQQMKNYEDLIDLSVFGFTFQTIDQALSIMFDPTDPTDPTA